ncbi:MAG TPA: ester cyclase [Ktedonobacteraceae bacterium]|nr:ester cyclase [Ktedonobacteraceae bacterium]
MQEEEYTIPAMVDEVRAGKMQRRQFMRQLTLMGISTAGVGAIVAAVVSRPFAATPVPQGNLHDASDHIQRHDEHLAHQSQGNIDQLHNDYAEDAVVEDSMYPHPFIGRAAIISRKSAGMAAIPGLKINVTNRIIQGNQLTVEWIASGTHSGDYPGLVASGRSFSIPGVTVVVRQNGKIVRESLYYDMNEVQRQLGPR